MQVDAKTTVGLTIWDTAGQERYHALNVTYYRYSKGALIVYDVTDKDSFEKVKKWHTELSKYLPGAPIMIAGNKCDLVNRTVPEEEADQFARSVGCEHINTSAKSGLNVKEIFQQLARKIYEREKTLTKDEPVKKLKGRGAVRADGMEEFNPDSNVKLTRQSDRTAKQN